MSVATVNKIIDSVFSQISTNFTLTEMIGYAKNLTKYKLGDSIGFPYENKTDMLNNVGSVVIPNTLSSNVTEVHQFLFGSDGYSVSSTVSEIESGITAKAADKAKEGIKIEDDEVPGTKKHSTGTTGNTTTGQTTSGSGTSGRTYGNTTGSYSGTTSGTTSGTGSGTSGGTTGGTGSGTTGGTSSGTGSGTNSGTTGGTGSGTTGGTTDGTE